MKPDKFNQNQGATTNKGNVGQGQAGQNWDKTGQTTGSGMNQPGKGTQGGSTQGTNR